MTDNRTTELREKLTERDVKWIAYEKKCNLTLEGFFDTRWDANGVQWSYLEINGKATLSPVGRVEIELTPEQAIAATLGSESVDYMLNTIGELEEENERLRSSCGTLTAEQVRKAIYKCSTYTSYDGYAYHASGMGLQAIADELNAELSGKVD